MPITYLPDLHLDLIRTTCIGMIGLADLTHYVYMLSERDWLRKPQLIDGRQAALTMSPQEVRILSELMVTLRERHGCAPVAFVPENTINACVASLYQDYGAGANPQFATFADASEAEQWLAGLTPTAHHPGRTERDVAGLRVLVVDDCEAVRGVVLRSLELADYEVRATGTAMEALDLVWQAQGPFDLALIDVHLAGTDGDILAAALRRLQPDLPVLFISGEDVPTRAEEGPLLMKPFGPQVLAQCVSEYLKTGCCHACAPVVGLEPAATP